MAEIDSLEIKINAEATKANDAIDKLCGKIDRLTTSMNKLDNVKIQNFSTSIKTFSDGMKNMQNIKMPDFNRVAKGLEKISSVNSDDILKFGNALTPLANGINVLSTANFDSKNLQGLLNSVSKLSSANVGSLNNVDFAQLGRNINQLTSSLANAPKIQQSVISMTNAIGNLAKFGENIPIVSNSLGSLGTALNKFVSDMANGASISDSTINFANAIGVLAKSGNTMQATTSNLSALCVELKKLMKELSNAPKVSQNLIDMTNALAKLARTGSSSGKAANSLVSSFNRISKASSGMKINLLSAVNGISAIRKSILQAMGIAGGFYAVFQGIKESINIASDLTEVQNVVDVTFGDFKSKIEDLADVSIPELGMSELTTKNIASRFQAMGTAMGFTQGKMADMSVELTRLTGDMASFYNVEQKAVGEDLESIFTGQTKPLRQYGLDLTEATLQEWAMKQGMDANINSMSQMEKTMLRYQYVMANTGAAQGDFLRTQDTWANQVRILKENFRELASVIGSSFINALKPLVRALNSAMGAIISFAKVVSNALGKIFGWKYEDATGGIASDFEDAAEGADGLASGTGAAADNAKKLKKQLQGIDELNVLSSNNDTGTGGGSGGGGGASGGEDASGGQWVQTDGILQSYESQLDTLFKLGEHIGQTLTDAMNSIDWDSVYQGARNFGSGLASFLNGLISPELFYATGRTIANSLNTAIYATLSFGETFDFSDFGNSIASGINGFFENFDFRSLARTINVWVDGIKTSLVTAIKNIKWSEVIGGVLEFADEIELDTIAIALGAFSWKYKGKEIVSGALSGLLSKQVALGIGTKTIPASASVAITFVVAKIGWEIGGWLYENVPQVQSASDFLVGSFGDYFTSQDAYHIETSFTGEIVFDTLLYGADKVFSFLEYLRDAQRSVFEFFVKGKFADKASELIAKISEKGNEIKQKLTLSFKQKKDKFVSWVLETVQKTKEFGADLKLGFEKAKENFVSKILEKIAGKKDFSADIKANFIDEKNPASKLTSWVLDKIRKKNPFSGNIKSIFTNGNPNSLVSWVFEKIKTTKDNLKKNIVSAISKSANTNPLIYWFLGKIKGRTGISQSIISRLTQGRSSSLVTWFLEKIKARTSIEKPVIAKMDIGGIGYNAFMGFVDMYNSLKSKAIDFALNFSAAAQDLRSWINGNIISKINVVFSKVPILRHHQLPYLANGGMLEGKGQLFVAREKGPELVTSYGNKTAVMNNNQIVESVSGGVEIAVRNANAEQIALLRQQNELLYDILQKETGISYKDVFDATRKGNIEYKAMHGHSALA